MSQELMTAIVGALGLGIGTLIPSVIGSRSSESAQMREEAARLREEIVALRKVVDRRHTHLSAYARTLEIVLLAWRLPSVAEQIETIRMARESLEKALGLHGGEGGG